MKSFLTAIALIFFAGISTAAPLIPRPLQSTDQVPLLNTGTGSAYNASMDQVKAYIGPGLVGPAGPQGPAGATGAAGPQGPAGATGPAGPQGAQGPAGLSLNWRGSWAGSPTGYVVNDAVYDAAAGGSYRAVAFSSGVQPSTDTNHNFWYPVAIKGATGAAGVTGPAGATGPAGPAGATGATGSTGATGATGPAGPQGAKGDKGDTGVGVPAGGTTGQILAKIDGTNYNTRWIDPPTGGATLDSPTFTTKITTPLVESNAGNGTHMVNATNTIAYSATPVLGDCYYSTYLSPAGWYCYDGTSPKLQGGGITALTGDITASGTGSVAATLANSGATAGTYTNATVTVNAKGLVTSASSGATPIGGTVGSTADRIPVASGTGGATLKASTVSIDPTTGATTVPKQSGVADGLLFYNGNSTETTGMGIIGPPTTMATSYYWQPSATPPTAGQTIQFGTPATQTVNGVSATVVPVSYATAAVSGIYVPTYTGVTNASSLTDQGTHYMRIGNEVRVEGTVIDNVSSGNSEFDISFPFASSVTASADCTGMAISTNGGASIPIIGQILCNTTNQRAKVQLNIGGGLSGGLYVKFSFTYTVK